MGSNNPRSYGSTEDKQRKRQAIAEATTCVVMEALKTDRETDKTGSNNLRGYGSIENRQRDRQDGKQQPTWLWKY